MTVGQSSLISLTHHSTTDIQEASVAGLASKSRWRHNWKSAQVVSTHLVCDPTIRQPGFDLPRQKWSLLNRFRTEQGHCCACRRKWRLTLICVLVGFDLPRQKWSLLNRFRTEQRHCCACRRKWRLTLICVLVARPRRCSTLSNSVP